MTQKNLFLIGPGLIGGSLLVRLKETRPDLKLHALTRRDEQAAELESIGVTPIKGTVEDTELIKQWVAKSDVVIHSASADDDKGALAVAHALRERPVRSEPTIFIQTSGNDELVNSARGDLTKKSNADKTLSDVDSSDAELDARIAPDAFHRHVDGPLRELIMNPEAEAAYNVKGAIMVPPLIYGIGSKPWSKLSIQTPMVTQAMMDSQAVSLPDPPTSRAWNCVWVHDLVEAYLLLLSHLEAGTVGDKSRNHYVFPAEEKTFDWKDHFQAIVSELQRLDHPCVVAKGTKLIESPEEFKEFIGGQGNPYADCFVQLVWGEKNSYTRPDLLCGKLGLKHKAKGVIDSILVGKELEGFIKADIQKKRKA